MSTKEVQHVLFLLHKIEYSAQTLETAELSWEKKMILLNSVAKITSQLIMKKKEELRTLDSKLRMAGLMGNLLYQEHLVMDISKRKLIFHGTNKLWLPILTLDHHKQDPQKMNILSLLATVSGISRKTMKSSILLITKILEQSWLEIYLKTSFTILIPIKEHKIIAHVLSFHLKKTNEKSSFNLYKIHIITLISNTTKYINNHEK